MGEAGERLIESRTGSQVIEVTHSEHEASALAANPVKHVVGDPHGTTSSCRILRQHLLTRERGLQPFIDAH
jgi:hypothetical protein